MKKIVTLFAAVICLSVTAKESILSYMNNSVQETEIVSNGESITVYMIKQLSNSMWSKTIKKGVYDSESKKLTVDRDTYRVTENTYSGGGREKYDYQAGGIYFFNL